MWDGQQLFTYLPMKFVFLTAFGIKFWVSDVLISYVCDSEMNDKLKIKLS